MQIWYVDEIDGNGFTVDLITIEISACGFVQYESFRHLNKVLGATKKKELSNFLVWKGFINFYNYR